MLPVFIFLFTPLSFAQKTEEKVENLMKIVQPLLGQGKQKEHLEGSFKIIEESEKINYPKGLVTGHFYVALNYISSAKYKESIKHLELAEKEPYLKKDPVLFAEVIRTYGEVFFFSGYYDESISKTKQILKLANKTKKEKMLLAMAYNNIGAAFEEKEQIDSAQFYYIKSLIAASEMPKGNQKKPLMSVCNSNLGGIYLEKGNLDSAEYYILQSVEINKNSNNKMSEILGFEQMGHLYFKKKEYQKSIESYQKAILIAKETNKQENLKNYYKKLSEVYKELDDELKYNEYAALYMKLNDSLASAKKSDIEMPLKKIIEEREVLFQKSKVGLYWIIGAIICFVLLMSLLAFQFHKKMKTKKEKIISNSSQALEKKKEIIFQKERETQVLTQKLNTAFEEVVELAKSNDPAFLARFQEVYPEFTKKLLEINPALVASELKFCALLYFNFNLKDIAEYTFISTKTVQNRKNRIRKRLNIPLDKDINRWIKDLDNKGLN